MKASWLRPCYQNLYLKRFGTSSWSQWILSRKIGSSEDIPQESPAQDPSLSTFSQLGYQQLPTTAPHPTSLLVFGDRRTRCTESRIEQQWTLSTCRRLFVDGGCGVRVCTSLMSAALVTDAPTLALAQVRMNEKCQPP